MNKKLFSWKALAGLALLVAMGLTSCKQGEEVDPSDPAGTTKPTKPGVITGTADLNVNLAVPTDLTTQFSSWWASLTTDQKKALTDKSEITIEVKSGIKLDGNEVVIPNIWTAPAGKIVNIVFKGAFTDVDKNPLKINTNNLVGGLVNVTLPAGEYNVTLNSTLAQISLASAAGTTIGTLDASVGIGKNGVSLKDGIAVKGYVKTAGDVALNGGTIEALSTASDVAAADKDKGVKISDGVFVKSVIATGDITVDAKGYKLPLDKITIAEGKTVTLTNSNVASNDNGWNGEPFVSVIEGLGDTGATLVVPDADALRNMTSVSNVNISASTVDLKVTSDIFTKTKFTTKSVVLSAPSMTGSVFAAPITINVDAADLTYAFSSVDFGTNQITMNKTAKKAIGTSNTTWYQWDATTSAWVEIEDASKVSAANKALQADALSFVADNDLYMTGTTPSTELAKKLAGKYWFSVTVNYAVDIADGDMKTIVSLDKCKYSGKLLEPATIANLFTTVSTWFQPKFNGVQLKWYYDSATSKYIAGAE